MTDSAKEGDSPHDRMAATGYDPQSPLWTWLGATPLQQRPPSIGEATISSPGTANDRRNGTSRHATIDEYQLADFRQAIEDKREVTNMLAELRGRRASYRSEVHAGDRELDPDYEYELKESERRLKQRLKPIEEVIGLAEHLVREGGRVSEKYRALLIEAGLGHRIDGTVPELAPIARLRQPAAERNQPGFFGSPLTLLALLTTLAGIIFLQVIGCLNK
jgi:hypothetical protein